MREEKKICDQRVKLKHFLKLARIVIKEEKQETSITQQVLQLHRSGYTLFNKSYTMKLILAATLLSSVTAFSPNAQNQRLSSSLSSAVAPPERTAPSAGWMPDWEDRPGLSPEEFMESDMSKPDKSEMWECPLTRWDSDGYVCFLPFLDYICFLFRIISDL
jgi:hypothetical protein